jgi:hypothetical protein
VSDQSAHKTSVDKHQELNLFRSHVTDAWTADRLCCKFLPAIAQCCKLRIDCKLTFHSVAPEDFRWLQALYTTSKISSKRKTTTWKTTEETTRRHECWDLNRPPWPKFVIECDDDITSDTTVAYFLLVASFSLTAPPYCHSRQTTMWLPYAAAAKSTENTTTSVPW